MCQYYLTKLRSNIILGWMYGHVPPVFLSDRLLDHAWQRIRKVIPKEKEHLSKKKISCPKPFNERFCVLITLVRQISEVISLINKSVHYFNNLIGLYKSAYPMLWIKRVNVATELWFTTSQTYRCWLEKRWIIEEQISSVYCDNKTPNPG